MMLMVADIQAVVCARRKLPKRIMRQKSPRGNITPETAPIVHARQDAMFLAFHLTRHGKARLAQFFGLTNHTSVMAAIDRVEERMANDLVERANIEALLEELRQAA